MALVGNCTVVQQVTSETEFEEITLTHPDGSTSVENVPVVTSTSQNYENVYVTIKQIELFQSYEGLNKIQWAIFQYAGYENKETRDADPENYLFWGSSELSSFPTSETPGGIVSYTWNYDLNLYNECYTKLLTLEGFENLTQD